MLDVLIIIPAVIVIIVLLLKAISLFLTGLYGRAITSLLYMGTILVIMFGDQLI